MINRRQLLTAGGAATAGLAMAACTPSETGTPEGPGGPVETAAKPNFIPYTGLEPDLPALDNGTSPCFKSYPAEPPAFTTSKPGSGGVVRCHTFMNSIPQPKPNQWWEAIEDAVGTEIEIEGAPIGDYPSKFQTMIAGGDIADMVAVLPNQVPQLGQLLEASFADLTDHLSGDASANYPGLANIPSYCWDACIYGGRIRLLPIHRFSLSRVSTLIRKDVAERLGAPLEPKDGQEYYELLKTLAVPAERIFATNNVHYLLDMVAIMMGVPNDWQVDGGTFTKDVETPEYLEAIEFVRKCWSERLIHPSAFEANFSLQTQAQYNGGTTVMGFGSTWSGNASQARTADPEAESSWFPTMKWDGSGPATMWVSSGAPYLTAIAKGDEARVAELIGVANWMASPWGTAEYTLFRSGIEGHDHTIDENGARVATEMGKAENPAGALVYMGSSALVHNNALYPDIAEMQYHSEAQGMDHVAPLPTVSLESETAQTKNAQMTKLLQDGYSDIITGRKEVSTWSDVVDTWRKRGGDAIRAEYEESLQATG